MKSYIFIFILISLSLSLSNAKLPQHFAENCSNEIQTIKELSESGKDQSSRILYEKDKPGIAILEGVVSQYSLNLISQLPSSIHTLALKLPRGGMAIPALEIAKKVREKKLNTYVGLTTCHSACTIIFQGGVQRIVDSMAHFSYHGPTNSESGDVCSRSIVKYGGDLMVRLGFPSSLRPVFESFSAVHYFGGNELRKHGIATHTRSLDIGYDSYIRQARQGFMEYCEDHPDDDDC